jgi:uncharacterized protein (TIGR03083 family)
MQVDPLAVYRAAHERVADLADDSVASVEVAACPSWTVKDVVAHLADFIDVYKTKGMEGFGPSWGDDGVARRRSRTLRECMDEWRAHVADPGDLFESRLAPVAVADVLAHEQDIRTAVGRPGSTDDPGIATALELAARVRREEDRRRTAARAADRG